MILTELPDYLYFSLAMEPFNKRLPFRYKHTSAKYVTVQFILKFLTLGHLS